MLGEEVKGKLNIMPMPARLTQLHEKYRPDDSFTVIVKGEASTKLCKAATRALRRLSGRTGLLFTQDYITADSKVDNPGIITSNRQGQVKLHEDESYQLEVLKDQILLTAETDIGALRDLETFCSCWM